MDWQPYLKASWELIMESEGKSQVFLDQELEAYLVHMMARNFRNNAFPPDIVCLEFARAKTRDDFRQIGDSCLFVDAWDVRRARLVERNYYEKMGQIAYTSAAVVARPAEQLFELIAKEFATLSRVLRQLKPVVSGHNGFSRA
ncbi:MAG: hypothetical protein RLZZ281_1182 [Pseudomonadota bacterium]|jgi:hypothetical protein